MEENENQSESNSVANRVAIMAEGGSKITAALAGITINASSKYEKTRKIAYVVAPRKIMARIGIKRGGMKENSSKKESGGEAAAACVGEESGGEK